MRLLLKIDDVLERVETFLAVVLFAALALSMLVTITARNLLGLSFQKLLELTPVMVLWLALVGSTLALKHQRHIKLELLLRHCSPALRRQAARLRSGFGLALSLLLGWAALTFVRSEIAIFGPWGWLAAALPLFFAQVAFRCLLTLLHPEVTGETPWS
jgi:TRAP-type C4-dicarboxylate transport system permease small subunit